MPRILVARLALCIALALTSSIAPPPSGSGPNVNGRWTNKLDQGAVWLNAGGGASPAVHMTLTRGFGAYHSQILWYDSHSGTPVEFHGGVMGWKPESTATDGNCSAYPLTRLQPMSLGNPPSNIFCSGHGVLASGKVLVTGGTEIGEVGITSTVVFDPSNRTWSAQGAMEQRRWYPTNTILPDGRMMVASGSRFGQIHGFGGRNQAGTLAPDSLELFGMTTAGEWNRGKTVQGGDWPLPRDAHTSCMNRTNDEWTMFGGRNQNGTYRDDTWLMYQNWDKDDREDYTAINVGPAIGETRPEQWSRSGST